MRLPKLRYIVPAGILLLALGGAGVWLAKTMSSTPMTVPSGTSIAVRIDRTLASNEASPGDRFGATVVEPIEVNGRPVIPQGSQVEGVVVNAHASGNLKGVARMRLTLETVDVNGHTYELHTGTVARFGPNHKKHNWEYIGGGAGSGALIGALAAGGKGALIGGPVGAGAGLAVAAITGERNVRIPAETVLIFKLSEPVVVRVNG
jgi:hypothetical protein